MAAIVGSGIKVDRVEVRAISSLGRQIPLAALLIVAEPIDAFRPLFTGSEQGSGNVGQDPGGNGAAPNIAPGRTEPIQSRIRITSLAPNQSVAARELVRGRAPRDTQRIWLIVHPRETDECWAQGPGTVNADGTWQIMSHFGEAGVEHAGKLYEVRAIADPRPSADMPLQAGRVSCGLDAPRHSESVNVVRM